MATSANCEARKSDSRRGRKATKATAAATSTAFAASSIHGLIPGPPGNAKHFLGSSYPAHCLVSEEAGRADEQHDEDHEQRHRQAQVGADEVDVRAGEGDDHPDR